MPADSPSSSLARSIAMHAVTGIVSGAVVLIAAGMMAAQAQPQPALPRKPPEIGPMIVSKLIVMDANGRARITMDCGERGEPTLQIRSSDGKPMVTIAASDAEGMNNYAVVGLSDPTTGKTIAVVQHDGVGEVAIERPVVPR